MLQRTPPSPCSKHAADWGRSKWQQGQRAREEQGGAPWILRAPWIFVWERSGWKLSVSEKSHGVLRVVGRRQLKTSGERRDKKERGDVVGPTDGSCFTRTRHASRARPGGRVACDPPREYYHFPSNNHIKGAIPAYVCKLHLSELDLSNNQLKGDFPRCQENTTSTAFAPYYICEQLGCSLSILDLKNNKLSGEFPGFLQNAAVLSFLDLSHNLFSGSVPTWIGGKMPSLEVLILRSNMFYGHLPKQLFTTLSSLHYLDVARNNISGRIPSSLASLKAMTGRYEASKNNYSDDSIITVNKDQERQFTLDYTNPIVLMDLSCNSLTGHIPVGLSLLKGLQTLNLSNNQLDGTVLDNIGALSKLESLDLSHNYLAGEIPSSLSDLTFLSWLNLSYNDLSGRIPSGRQLQTLNVPSMYMGNPGLCGPPLPNNCSNGANPSAHDDEHEDDATHDTAFLFRGMSTGYGMGLWTVYCVLLFSKTCRAACFRLFDRLYDKSYVQVALIKARVTL